MTQSWLSRTRTRGMGGLEISLAIAAVWAWQSVLALVVSWPTAALVRAAVAGDPKGEDALFRPGSLALLGWLARDAHAITSLANMAAVVGVVGAFVGLLPLAGLILAVTVASGTKAPNGRRARVSAEHAWRTFPSFASLFAVISTAQGLAVGAGFLAFEAVAGALHESLGEAHSEEAGAAVALVFGALAGILFVLQDLARAAVVCRGLGTLSALVWAGEVFVRNPYELLGAWLARAIAGLALVIIGCELAGWVGNRDGLPWIILAVAHQTVVVTRIGIRASWFGKAVHAVGLGATERRDDAADGPLPPSEGTPSPSEPR